MIVDYFFSLSTYKITDYTCSICSPTFCCIYTNEQNTDTDISC